MSSKFNGYKNNKTPVVLLGGNMGTLDASSEIRQSLNALHWKFKEVQGVYKGDSEVCFVIPVTQDVQLRALKALAKHFKQESILWLDADRNAKLIDLKNNTDLLLGRLESFTQAQFNMLNDSLKENYTFDGSYYYIAV